MAKPTSLSTAFDQYIIRDQLGEGGAGRVYEVADSKGNLWAAKVLVADRLTEERRKRFRHEIAFCQKATHPGIVRVHDYGFVEQGKVRVPFYIMPRYGATLRHLMDAGLEKNQVLPVLIELFDATATAHQHGVWHRDIKPQNVLINEARMPVLADFGIAHFEEQHLLTAMETRDASRMANFSYAAPEQRVKGADVDHRADIFALGLIGFELFTNEIPQGAGFKRISDAYPALSSLDSILEEMIQHSADRRPSSLREIEQRLRSLAGPQAEEQACSNTVLSANPMLARAMQLRVSMDLAEYKKKLLSSHEGVEQAKNSAERIWKGIQSGAEEINKLLEMQLRFDSVQGMAEVRLGHVSLTGRLELQYGNSLDGADLKFCTWAGDAPLPGRHFFERPGKTSERIFVPDVDSDKTLKWRQRNGNVTLFAEDDVVQECLRLLLDAHEKIAAK